MGFKSGKDLKWGSALVAAARFRNRAVRGGWRASRRRWGGGGTLISSPVVETSEKAVHLDVPVR